MALPPEPISELLSGASIVVDAEVIEILGTGDPLPKPEAPRGATSIGVMIPMQIVRLSVRRVLLNRDGALVADVLVVEKPIATYALRVGNQGGFALDGASPRRAILGRHGPDSYGIAALEKAIAADAAHP